MNDKVYQLIDSYRDEFITTLRQWVSVPSVKADPAEGAPFGPDVRRMLDLALETGRKMGFAAENIDGYAGDMVLGETGDEIAVLGHLDVVPVGDGWTREPFGGQLEGDRMYGRGTGDDKGPTLAALFAMRAIKEAGLPLKRRVRLILGCDEESGWQDMAYYAKKKPLPAIGFSPDACFPVINTEKGMIHLALSAPAADESLPLLRMATGDRLNVIPGESEALLAGGEDVAAKVRAYAQQTGLPYQAQVTPEGVLVKATGIPGHSAMPEGRRNASGMMLKLFEALGATGPLKTLAQAVGLQSDGTGLGCACRDELSGALTCNMGILHLENGVFKATLDFRCPVSADLEALRAAAEAHLPGFTVETLEIKPAHHVPADSELVRQLLAAYEEETGLKGEAIAIGGGTYAKVLQQGVAFGASFPGDEDLAHQADEYVSVDGLMKAMKVFANALIRLAC